MMGKAGFAVYFRPTLPLRVLRLAVKWQPGKVGLVSPQTAVDDGQGRFRRSFSLHPQPVEYFFFIGD
jgi:hypothetical protein